MHPKMHLSAPFFLTHLNSSSLLHHQLAKLVCKWLINYDPKAHSKSHFPRCKFSYALVDTISSLVQSLSRDNHTMLTIAAFMYTERFIKQVGITQDAIVNVCIVSAMITVKYWDDWMEVSNAEIADMAGLSVSYINKMERIFLQKVGYNLSICPKEINTFWYNL